MENHFEINPTDGPVPRRLKALDAGGRGSQRRGQRSEPQLDAPAIAVGRNVMLDDRHLDDVGRG